MTFETIKTLEILKTKYFESNSKEIHILKDELLAFTTGFEWNDIVNELTYKGYINKQSCVCMDRIIFLLKEYAIDYFNGKVSLENDEKQNIQQINNFYGDYNQVGDYCSMEIHSNEDAIRIIEDMLNLTKGNDNIYQKIKELEEVTNKKDKAKALEIIAAIISIIIAIPTLYGMLMPGLTQLIHFFQYFNI